MDPDKSSSTANLLQQLHDKEVHIRNLEAIINQRDSEIETLRAGLSDPGQLEASCARTKDFWRPTPRPPLSATVPPAAEPTPPRRSFRQFLFHHLVETYGMQIGILRQHPPTPFKPERFPPGRLPPERLPWLAVVTPSFNQAPFIEATLCSILDQDYPRLLYAVCDGASTDASASIIARYGSRLAFWDSAPDGGQSDAVGKGFARLAAQLGVDDLMGWLNSDDLSMPGSLRHVAEYFAAHPEVDAVYGHRVIIDDDGREIGRWIMPRHEPAALEWVDYVPQETLFWRKRAWDRVGGLDPSFHFALDWDLLARFTQAGLRVVRLPWFLGSFRIHEAQKTTRHIHSTGAEEMVRVREKFHGPEKPEQLEQIEVWANRIRLRGALTARLLALGVRW